MREFHSRVLEAYGSSQSPYIDHRTFMLLMWPDPAASPIDSTSSLSLFIQTHDGP